MANEGDFAQETEELFQRVSLANSLAKNVNSPKAIGKCLNCDEKLAPPKRWCDSFCRDDWQRLENAKRHKAGRALINAESMGE
jgi:hypothetical protein